MEEEATFLEALVRSLSMILVSEIGDETFIIAAILAMRNPKRIVFSGAIAALTVMTIISAALGYIVPNLISKQTTHNAATLLYTFFGFRLLYIGYNSKKNEIHEEIAEVNQKLVSHLVLSSPRPSTIPFHHHSRKRVSEYFVGEREKWVILIGFSIPSSLSKKRETD